jgi:hypothetical protein
MKRSWVVIILAGLGFTAIVLVLFATQLGLAHSTTWGKGRVMLCAFGLALIIGAYLCLDPRWQIHRLLARLVPVKDARSYLVASMCVLLSAAIYLWFSTTGLWIQWPDNSGSVMYDRLVTSFWKGDLALQIQPDTALLRLPDPYEPDARLNIPNLDKVWDMSLYGGKVYMYWGAAPALLMVILKLMIPGTIGDQFLVLGYSLGLLVFQSLLILYLWRRFFYSLPEWTLAAPLLFAGLAEPLLWSLNVPLIYEAAIMAGQFFLMGGLYFVVTALDVRSFSARRLVLAGAFLSFAVGSRATLVIPVIFLSLMAAWWILFGSDRPLQTIGAAHALTGLAAPLMLGAIIISWYNWARFGSPFEFGFRYQIAAVNYYRDYSAIFLPRYIPPNLYMYLLNPPHIFRTFPLVRPGLNKPLMNAYYNNYSPHVYHSEQVVGLLYAAPLAILVLIPMASLLIKGRWPDQPSGSVPSRSTEPFLSWIVVGLSVSFLLTSASILLYFYAAIRFLMDVFPLLALITSIGFWQGYLFLGSKPISRIFYSGLTMFLAAESIGIAIVLPLADPIQRFQEKNPQLYDSLAHSFNLWIRSLPR